MSDKSLKDLTICVRLSTEKFGSFRALKSDQVEEAAGTFDADKDYLRARKKLLDTKQDAYKRITGCLNEARHAWRLFTTPYPEVGIRLLRKDKMAEFEKRMEGIKADLTAAVKEAMTPAEGETISPYQKLIEAAREQLGTLFNPSDYPATLEGEFGIGWGYVTADPPNWLKSIAPEVYERECARVRAQFDEAVVLANQAFALELKAMVDNLVTRLATPTEGKKTVLKTAAVTNLTDFFARFRELNVGGSEDLEKVIAEAEAVIAGKSPDELRKSGELRKTVSEGLAKVSESLKGMTAAQTSRKFSFDAEEAA